MESSAKVTLIDSGALLAFLSREDKFHGAAVAAFKELPPTLVTCESVVSEVCFLLQRNHGDIRSVLALLRGGIISIVSLEDELGAIFDLMDKYANVPMSFADASLVRLAEIQPKSVVVTTDSDFAIYRMKRNQKVPVKWVR